MVGRRLRLAVGRDVPLELFDAGGLPAWTKRGNRTRRPATSPERGEPALVGSDEGFGGDETPATPRWTNGEPSRRGSGAAAWRLSPVEPDGTFLVTFYRELRGTGLKARISGTSSARHDVAFGQLPTSPWMSGAVQMAVVV